uniref:Uncharacterized protein n=1 Tax=Daphnia magna TaxID=35525 RepID=A0A0P6EXL7_9CRUS
MAYLAHAYQELPFWFTDLKTIIFKSFQVCYGRRTADELNSSKRHCTIRQNPNGRCIENVGHLLMKFSPALFRGCVIICRTVVKECFH